MKIVLCTASLCLLAALLIVPLLSHSAANALPGQTAAGIIYCSSDDGRRKICPADTGNGVQLTKQRSDTPCVFGQSWGYDRRGIWVDRGCRAEFSAGYNGGGPGGPGGGPGGPGPGWPGWGNNYNVYCASDDGRRNYCPVETSGGVRLVRKRSDSACTFGVSWGSDRRGIWVDRGCRADFEIGQAGWQPTPARTVYCASDNMSRNFCNADTRNGVRIIRQRSDSDCIYGRTWGYDRSRIWVDRGCRADFEIGR
jgi:Protein of unknown function (DUF3011)